MSVMNMCSPDVYRKMISGLSRETMQRHWTDSGTALIQSPMGQKSLAVFTSDRINEGFLQENVWPFSRAARKSGRNNEVTVFNTEVAVRRVTRCSQNFHPSRCTGSLFLHGNNGK